MPEGFIYKPEIITVEEEKELINKLQSLEFDNFKYKEYQAKRKTVSFGYFYSFETFKMSFAGEIPEFLQKIKEKLAEIAGIPKEEFVQVSIIEYSPGSGIGWHRDAPQFGIIGGVSLNAGTPMRLRFGEPRKRKYESKFLMPRSAYVLSGPSRTQWQHHVPPVNKLRYAITFRTLSKNKPNKVNNQPLQAAGAMNCHAAPQRLLSQYGAGIS